LPYCQENQENMSKKVDYWSQESGDQTSKMYHVHFQ